MARPKHRKRNENLRRNVIQGLVLAVPILLFSVVIYSKQTTSLDFPTNIVSIPSAQADNAESYIHAEPVYAPSHEAKQNSLPKLTTAPSLLPKMKPHTNATRPPTTPKKTTAPITTTTRKVVPIVPAPAPPPPQEPSLSSPQTTPQQPQPPEQGSTQPQNPSSDQTSPTCSGEKIPDLHSIAPDLFGPCSGDLPLLSLIGIHPL